MRAEGSIKRHNDILSAINPHITPFVSELDRKLLLLIMGGGKHRIKDNHYTRGGNVCRIVETFEPYEEVYLSRDLLIYFLKSKTR